MSALPVHGDSTLPFVETNQFSDPGSQKSVRYSVGALGRELHQLALDQPFEGALHCGCRAEPVPPAIGLREDLVLISDQSREHQTLVN